MQNKSGGVKIFLTLFALFNASEKFPAKKFFIFLFFYLFVLFALFSYFVLFICFIFLFICFA